MNKVKVLSNSSFSENEKVVDKRMTDYFFVVKYSCLAERVGERDGTLALAVTAGFIALGENMKKEAA